MNIVETQELSKYYPGNVRALENCSLQVSSGKIFSLLGPNGAGKTTLIKLLLGIVFPTTGSAKILGRDISDYRVHAKIGYLAENHRFPEFLTANQVLYYYGKISGVEPSLIKERIPAMLKLVNLEGWGDTKIRKFSKGMLQRTGLAQAMLSDPELLFLDEPTDGIDPVGRREIRDILQNLRDRGKTIFLNSHLLSEVERISDEIAILKHGKLIRKGSVEDFISVKEQYHIEVADHQDVLTAVCQEQKITAFSENSHYVVSVQDDDQLNQLIDALRAREVTIRSIVPRKISLEDFFIDVIEEKDGEQQ